MNTYLLIKTLHIISATLLVGTGFGTAFYMLWVNRSGSVAAQSVVALYAFAGVCWLPVVWLQLQMANIAAAADAAGAREMPPRYRTLARRWELLGYPAFCATVVI